MIAEHVAQQDLEKIFDAFSSTADGKYVHVCYIPKNRAYWSKEAVEYFGLPGCDVQNPADTWMEHLEPEVRPYYKEKLQAVFEGRADSFEMIYRARNKDGVYVTCTGKGKLIRDENGMPKFFAGSIINHENTDTIDPVTGLYSRNNLLNIMQGHSKNHTPYYLLIIGIHRFFDINSSYSYSFGNKVLKEMADYAIENRQGGLLFRPEGTKMILLMDPQTHSVEDVKGLFELLRRHYQSLIVVDGIHIAVDICGALVKVGPDGVDANAVYNSALYALDKSKRENVQELLVVDEYMSSTNGKHLETLSVIRNSIVEDFRGFYLVYQPIVNAITEKVVGMEALLRWRDKKHGVVPPNEFIPWLEKDPIFFELGNWILRQAMRDAKKVFGKKPDFTVNVNLAYPQLQRVDFKENLNRIVKAEKFPAGNLKLELTERCKLIDIDTLRNDMIFFKGQGMMTALDDFGTGYSAMNLMISLPTDQVKIDKSFIDDIQTDISKQSLLRAITTCAREIGKTVCIEGIENKEMADYLRSNFPVEYFQGYYYSRPVMIDEFLAWAEKML